MSTIHKAGSDGHGPFGMTLDEYEVPVIDMSPEDLAKQLDRGFLARVAGKPPGSKPKVKGVVRPPTIQIARKQPATKTNPPRAGFGVSAPVKRLPAKKVTAKKIAAKKAPPRFPHIPEYVPRDAMRALNSTQKPQTFTIQPVNTKRLAMEEVRSKIVNTLRVPANLKKEFLAKLKSNQDQIAEFLLLKIATFDLAVPTAVETLQEYLADSTGIPTSADLGRVEGMLGKISEMRTLEFLCKLCGMSKSQIDMLTNDMLAPELKRPEDPLKHIAKALLAQKEQQGSTRPAAKKRRAPSDPRELEARDRLARTATNLFSGRDSL